MARMSKKLKLVQESNQSLRSQTHLSDIFFSVEEENFDLHSQILYPFMKEYINCHSRTGNQMKMTGRSPDNRIFLEKFPGGKVCFEEIVRFCYFQDDSFSVDYSNFSRLYYGSMYLHMEGEGNIISIVENFLQEGHSLSELLESYKSAVLLEQEYSLPQNLSTKVMDNIVMKVWECPSLDFHGIGHHFTQDYNPHISECFVESAKKLGLMHLYPMASSMVRIVIAADKALSAQSKPNGGANPSLPLSETGANHLLSELNMKTLYLDSKLDALKQLHSDRYALIKNGKLGFLKEAIDPEIPPFFPLTPRISNADAISFSKITLETLKLTENKLSIAGSSNRVRSIVSLMKRMLTLLMYKLGAMLDDDPKAFGIADIRGVLKAAMRQNNPRRVSILLEAGAWEYMLFADRLEALTLVLTPEYKDILCAILNLQSKKQLLQLFLELLEFNRVNEYVLDMFVAAGVDVNSTREKGGNTALIVACQIGSLPQVELLLASGANPTLKNEQGLTALQVAEKKCFHEVAAILRNAQLRP
eukprot:CAMPEP_0117751190 /NCGR_PEP_ID=MMETSP0947-20121206/10824_1 /TAXON_ID=44440 /ORGANISM="Chattonella subsalsa, Strain CCMP2191" /LENGTH=530 /DNA_ID=CAMNT_0005569517 /DNA_START=382 /DNA_END=1974 /DNA_ORIENTATION=-